MAAIAAANHSLTFDLTNDALADHDDLARWLQLAGAFNLGAGRTYLFGDANLDGVVDGSDFGIWNSNKFTVTAAWSRGDFNADGAIDGSDFGVWNSHKFFSSRPIKQRPVRPCSLRNATWSFLSLTPEESLVPSDA